MALKDIVRKWLGVDAPSEAPKREPMKISRGARAQIAAMGRTPVSPFVVPQMPPFIAKGRRVAKDSVSPAALYQWASQGAFSEGLGFMGYPFLAELYQRVEYRRVCEIWASECTRKWIKLTGENKDRVAEIEKELDKFAVREKFREAAEVDGGFGRSAIYIDLGETDARQISGPLIVTKETVEMGSLINLKVVEPLWCYPLNYNATNALSEDFYAPKQWQVMGQTVHNTRMLTFIGRELPDILKPAYMFGGLSLSQMIMPYVNNFLDARESVAKMLTNFSRMVLATDMGTIVTGGGSETMDGRAEIYAGYADNNGLHVINKETEEFTNVSAPLSTLDALLAQSQEQIASAAGIPLIVLLKITPKGLNTSSDGELRAFYAEIKGYQERVFRNPLKTVLNLLQINLDGEIDDSIDFEFIDLWEPDAEALARIRKSDGDLDTELIAAGVVSNDEARDRNARDEQSPYFGIIEPGTPAPEAPDDADELAALAKPRESEDV